MQSLKTLIYEITERITTETALSSIFLRVFVNTFSLCRDGSSWVEPVLSNVSCSRTQHSDAGEARNSNAHVTR